ncbi:MAG: OmpH family outer membrane protein [Elusimicrobiota bacterium]
MRYIIFLFFLFFSFPLVSIEISLEENKAESGTVGYVDITRIFKIFSVNPKKNFEKLVAEKQKIIDEKKKEADYYKATKEKLNSEYQIAKMYEEFYKNISTMTDVNKSTDIISENENFEQQISTDSLLTTTTTLATSSDEIPKIEDEPYIVMPGIGKVSINKFKFSVSSSTIEIEKAINELDNKIMSIDSEINEMKAKFDDELSKKAMKENEKILKKIYEAIEEVAGEEGVSVIVDKKNILFGRKTVDLTDKVIEKID